MLLLLLLSQLWEGSLSQKLWVQRSVTVQEGLCAQVFCNFSYALIPYPSYGYWFRQGDNIRDPPVATNNPYRDVKEETRGRFHLLGKPRTQDCSLRITGAQRTDTGLYFFRYENGDKFSFVRDPLYVDVTDLIQKPDIFVPKMLESGNPVTLNCTFPWGCEENRALAFSWMGAAVSSPQDSPRASPSSEFSFIPGHQLHGTNLTCKVTLPGGHLSTERTIQLNVSYAVQDLTITISQENSTDFISGNSSSFTIQEGKALHLSCGANSNPPAILIWTLGNQSLTFPYLSNDGVLLLDLPSVRPTDRGQYTCLAQHPLGSKQISLNLFVQYPPKILRPSCSWAKETLLCTCSVEAEPAPSLHWWVEGKLVEGNSSNSTFQVKSNKSEPWVNSSLNVKVERMASITIGCEGKNQQGTHTFLLQLVPDRSSLTHGFQQGLIMGVLCGAGITSLLALCLLLLVKMLKKKPVAVPGVFKEDEGPKRLSWVDQSLDPIPPAADTGPTTVALEDGQDELFYACLNFQEGKARDAHGSTEPFTEYSEIKFQ